MNGEEKILNKLGEFGERFDRIDAKLEEHDRRLEEHDRRFDGLDAKLAEHDRQFDVLATKLLEHDRRFEEVDMRFDSLEKTMLTGFDEVKSMLSPLVEQVTMQGAAISRIERQVDRNTKDIVEIKAKIA